MATNIEELIISAWKNKVIDIVWQGKAIERSEEIIQDWIDTVQIELSDAVAVIVETDSKKSVTYKRYTPALPVTEKALELLRFFEKKPSFKDLSLLFEEKNLHEILYLFEKQKLIKMTPTRSFEGIISEKYLENYRLEEIV
jgi:hypothetical protein